MYRQEYCSLTYEKINQKYVYFAKNLTLLLVLNGRLEIEDEGTKSIVNPGEVYCLNLNHLGTLENRNDEPTTVLFLTIDSLFFAAQFYSFFNVTFSVSVEQPAATELANTIIELAINEFSQNEERKLYYLMKLETIALLLVQKFQDESRHATIISKNFYLRDILEYIDTHYATGIKAKDVADHFYLSASTLSKIFKRETGEYLAKYLKKIQIQKSISELLYTKKSIEQLALDFGFNSAKVYREQFKAVFGVTPAEYRQAHYGKKQKVNKQPANAQTEKQTKAIIQLLYTLLKHHDAESLPKYLEHRSKHLVIREATQMTKRKNAKVIVQLASLADLANKKVQQELQLLKKKQAIDSINCHHLFLTPSVSYHLAQQFPLNSFTPFEELDQAIEFAKALSLEIMLTFSLPKTAIEKEAFNVYRDFFYHLQHKFSRDALSSIRLNVTLSNPFSMKELQQYLSFRSQIKAFSASIQTGLKLPIADPFDEATVRARLSKLNTLLAEECDFLTLNADPNFIFKETESNITDWHYYHQYVHYKIHFFLKVMKEQRLKLPIYLLEWNTLTGTTIDYNGLFFRGAIIVNDMLYLDKLIDGYGFWLNVEAHEREHQQNELSGAGLDLFHFQSKKRPAYYCVELVRRIQGTILSEGDFYLLTQNQEKLQLLLWNTNYFDPQLSSEKAFIESQALDITLEISSFLSGLYQIKQIDFDRNHGAVFYVYSQFNKAKQLDAETEAYINAKTLLDLKVFDRYITNHFTHFLTLDTNAVTLLEFTPLSVH